MQFFILSYINIRKFFNNFRAPSLSKFLEITFIFITGAFFFVLNLYFSDRIIRGIYTVEFFGRSLLFKFISLSFMSIFLMLVFSSLIASISIMFSKDELEFLFSIPVKNLSVFFSKSWEVYLNSSWMVLVFGVPILINLARLLDNSFLYYLKIFLFFVIFSLVPFFIGHIISILLSLIIPRKKLYPVILIISMSILIFIVFIIRMIRPEQFFEVDGIISLSTFLKNFSLPKVNYLPNTWYVWILFEKFNRARASSSYLLLATTTVVLFIINAVIGRFIYFRAFLNSKKTGELKKTYSYKMRKFSIMQSLLNKDWKIFWRQPSQWFQIIILMGIGILYLYNIKVLPFEKYNLNNMIIIMNIALLGFITSAITARFSFTSFSYEGKQLWIIKSLPIREGTFLWSKYIFTFIPIVVLIETLTILTNIMLRVSPWIFVMMIVLSFFTAVALNSLSIGLGIYFPRFNEENPAKILMSTGGFIYMFLSFSYIFLVLIIMARFYVPLLLGRSYFFFNNLIIGFYVIIYLIINFAYTFIPYKMGLRKLKELKL